MRLREFFRHGSWTSVIILAGLLAIWSGARLIYLATTPPTDGLPALVQRELSNLDKAAFHLSEIVVKSDKSPASESRLLEIHRLIEGNLEAIDRSAPFLRHRQAAADRLFTVVSATKAPLQALANSGLSGDERTRRRFAAIECINEILYHSNLLKDRLAVFAAVDPGVLGRPWRPLALVFLLSLTVAGIATALLRSSLKLKKTLEELRGDRELYNNVYLNSPLAFVIWDERTRIVDWNRRAEEMFEWAKSEAVGTSIFELAVPDSARSAVREVVTLLLRGETPRPIVNENVTKSGKVRHCEWHNAPLHDADGRITGAISLALDVTERVRSEAALRESEHRYKSLFENAPDAIVVLDTEGENAGRFLEANPAAAELAGIDVERLRGMRLSDFETEKNDISFLERFRRLQAEGEVTSILSFRSAKGHCFAIEAHRTITTINGRPCVIAFGRDITEKRRAEQALRESEEMKHALLAAIPDKIFRIRADGTYLDFHAPAGALLYAKPSEFLGKKIADVMPPEMAERMMEGIGRVISQDRECVHEWDFPIEGVPTTWEFRTVKAKDDEVLGIARDVTRQKQAERQREAALEALGERERRFRLLVEGCTIGITESRPDGLVLDANDAYLQIIGYSREDLVAGNVRWNLMTPPEYADLDAAAFRERCERGGSKPYEKEYIRKDGSRIPVLVGSVMLDHERKTSLCFVIDISRLRAAEKLAGDSHELAEAIRRAQLDFIKNGDVRPVCQGLLDSINHLTQSRFGFIGEINEDADGTPYLRSLASSNIAWDAESRKLYEESQENGFVFRNLKTLFGHVMTTGRSVLANDARNDERRGGTPHGHPPIDSFLGVPFLQGERVVGMVGMANRPGGYDESIVEFLGPLMATCASIIEADRNRRRREKLDADLKASKELAESANQAKDRFIAVLSHELRTPLTPILAAVTSQLDDERIPPSVARTYEMIRRNIEIEARLIDDLLDVSRINRGVFDLRKRPTDAHAVARQALDVCADDVNNAGLEVHLHFKAKSHWVDADPDRLRQVFWNLIKNAVKFTPAGNSITILTKNRPEPGGARELLLVEVVDSGIGIEPADIARIFTPFEQAESLDRKRDGLGLGLSISRSVVEAHDGRLNASSEGRNRGSVFTVELATIAEPAQEQVGHSHARSPSPIDRANLAPVEVGKPLRILLVEDNKDTLRCLATLLERQGHLVSPAASYSTARALGESESFDLLISDIELPDGSGLDLPRATKKDWNNRAIAMSGFGSEDDVRRSKKCGFAVHLTKPIDFRTLTTVIRQVVGDGKLDGDSAGNRTGNAKGMVMGNGNGHAAGVGS